MASKRIALVYCNGVSDMRMTFAGRALERAGYTVDLLQIVYSYQLAHYDLFVFLRPQEPACGLIAYLVQAGIPVIIDLDDDFHSIPVSNPAHKIIGPGNAAYLNLLDKTVKSVDMVTVASVELINRYQGKAFKVIPNGWDEENRLWKLPRWGMVDKTVIGYAGTPTHVNDFKIALPGLLRLLQERPDVGVMIGGDHHLYNLLSAVPEAQKMFIPGAAYDDYPLMLAACDIWIAPLVDDVFNRAKSDIRLVEAGARGIPWVASPLPQYVAWCADSGLFALNDSDWHEALSTMLFPGIKERLGAFGHERALTRIVEAVGKQWVELVDTVLA